jgi:hypothetical protein
MGTLQSFEESWSEDGLQSRVATAALPHRRLICGAATPSIITLMHDGRREACARAKAAVISPALDTSSPWPPRAAHTWS